MDALHQLEIWINLFFQSLGPWLKIPMQALSMLGQEEFFLLLMPTLYWMFDGVLGLRVAMMLLLSTAINMGTKMAFHSPRPYWFDPRVQGLAAESSFGIPSGHASNTLAVWGILAIGSKSKMVRAALFILIFLIGLSRIYLGVHFLSDVLVGWLLSGLLLWVFLRFEAPATRWISTLSLGGKLASALLSALLLGGVILLGRAAAGSWELPSAWQQNALAAIPDSELDPLNIDGAFTVSGTWFGMLAGAAWIFHKQKKLWKAAGTPRQQILCYVIGIVGIFALWYLLGKIFPREQDVLSYSLRFLRYTLIGAWVSAVGPLLFQRLGLAQSH